MKFYDPAYVESSIIAFVVFPAPPFKCCTSAGKICKRNVNKACPGRGLFSGFGAAVVGAFYRHHYFINSLCIHINNFEIEDAPA